MKFGNWPDPIHRNFNLRSKIIDENWEILGKTVQQ